MKLRSLLVFGASGLALCVSLVAKPAPAEIVIKGQNVAETGFVTKADSAKIYFSASPTGKNARAYPRKLVERLTFKAPDGWAEAEEGRLGGKYSVAAKAYGKIAADYREVEAIEDNYGSLARLQQLACLRNLGNYTELAKKRPLLKKIGLSKKYHNQVELFVGWGALSKLNTPAEVDQLERLVSDFREMEMVPEQLAQAFYLSGVAQEKKGNPGKALTDYHRVFTLDFGTDRGLSKMAMETALKLYAAEQKIHKDRQRLEEAHGLAAVFVKVFGKVPSEAARFTKPLPPLDSNKPE
jgi:hypothetical protein